jgi:flagellar biosynthesis/type III secretory pathway chaperone
MDQNSVVVRLTQLLDQEVSAHRRMLEHLQQEQTALVDADVTGIRKAVNLQEYLIEDIRKLEQEREELMAALARMMDGASMPITFAAIIEWADEPHTERLVQVYDNLKAVLKDVTRANEQNRQLVESGLYFVESNLQLFFDLSQDEPCYQPRPTSTKTAPKVSRLIDRKA